MPKRPESSDSDESRAKPCPRPRYCDEHADEVQTLFVVECDLLLEGAVTAA
jgi:hypothetical protein